MEERFFTVLLFAFSFNLIISETQQQQHRHQNAADLEQGSAYDPSGDDSTDDDDHTVPESTEPEGSGTQIFDDDENKALTPCLRQQKAPGTSAMSADAFRPQCTSNGKFRQIQCDSKKCWCVDKDGMKTSAAEVPLSEKPNCNRRHGPEFIPARTHGPLGAAGPDLEGRNADDITIEEMSTFRPIDSEKTTLRKMRKMQSTAGPDLGFGSSDVSEKVPAPTFLSLIYKDPLIFAGIVGGVVLALLCIVLLVMFTIYRMRKKDEGSYALEEPKKSYGFAYTRARDKEFFA